MTKETQPFDLAGWCQARPHVASLCAGAFAGTVSETLLFPLDCLKTRLQSKRGFYESGGFRGMYRGLGTAICAAAPASAIFFSTYDASKRALTPHDHMQSVLGFCSIGLISSILGELAAGVYRVPMDLVKQRQQAGPGSSLRDVVRSVRSTHNSVFLASYMASFSRDIMHSSLQFPMYEYLKLALLRWNRLRKDGKEGLPTWQAASCGSVAGVISAFLTTPLDLLRTRLNLREGDLREKDAGQRRLRSLPPLGLLRQEFLDVYRTRGIPGFFAGGTCRAAWMGLGGFIFLGSFELAKKHLLGEGAIVMDMELDPDSVWAAAVDPAPVASEAVTAATAAELGDLAAAPLEPPESAVAAALRPEGTARSSRQLGDAPPALLSFLSGLMAGMCVDIPLHPLDTVKTRMQAPDGFWSAGGFRSLWSGFSAVCLVSVPGSACFFVIYDGTRHFLERNVPPALQDKKICHRAGRGGSCFG